jgi:large subunit ribosomal protein L23
MPRHIPQTTSLDLQPHQIVLRPLVTEKGMHRSTRNNAYAFEVNRLANKGDVKKAVEELFEVKVLKVHIQNRKGKPRRTKFHLGQTATWKKAIVSLDPEHRIELF